MSRNTQHMMLFCTAVVLFVTACLYGQRNVSMLTNALSERVQTTAAMEGRLHATLRISKASSYSGTEVLHTVRQMTGSGVQVEVDGRAYGIDPLVDPSATVPVQLSESYRPEYSRSATGELLKIAFWKEAVLN